MYKLGDEKGEILEREIAKMDAQPRNALELGTFLGYSALRTARRLAPGGKLHCIGARAHRARHACTRARARARTPIPFLSHTQCPRALLTHPRPHTRIQP